MTLYRITKSKYANDLSGTGGLHGAGRWHREGTRILYLAEHTSLAKLEVLVNSRKLPRNQSLVTVEIPTKASTTHVDPNRLSPGWEKIPYFEELADTAGEWLDESKFWIMRVPSAQSPTEYNYLLNPLHPEHKTITLVSVEEHLFDTRLK